MKRIAFYCRVSTFHQEKDETIKVQLEELARVYKGENVVNIYKDDGFSGSFLDRPALNQLREDAKGGLFDTIALYNLDRLSRKTAHQLLLIDEFRKREIKIEVLGKDFENTPQGEFSLTVLSAAAQLEKELIVQRMRDGKYRRARAGILVGCSVPTYGFKIVKRDRDKGQEAYFEEDPIEANNLKSIFKTYLEVESIRETIRRITKLGIRTRKEKVFTTKGIGNLLRNETYIGNYYFGKSYPCEAKNPKLEKNRGRLTSKKMKPRADWLLIKVKPIISKEIFNKVREVLNERSGRGFYKNSKYQYLCSGLIRCLKCGRIYYGRPNTKYFSKGENRQKVHLSYLCSGRSKPALLSERCLGSRIIGVERLDGAIWEYVSNLIADPARVKNAITLLRERRNNDRGVNEKAKDALAEEKMKIKMKKSKILDLYANSGLGREELDEKVLEFNKQEALFDKEIARIDNELKNMSDMSSAEEEVENLCLSYKEKLNNPSFELKKMVIRKWVKEINLEEDGKIIIKVKVPEVMGGSMSISTFNNHNVSLNNQCRLCGPALWAEFC